MSSKDKKNEIGKKEQLIFRFPGNIITTLVISFLLGILLDIFLNFNTYCAFDAVMYLVGRGDNGLELSDFENLITILSFLVIPPTLTVALGTYLLNFRFNNPKSAFFLIPFSLFVFCLTFFVLENFFGGGDMELLIIIIGVQLYIVASGAYSALLYARMTSKNLN